MMKPSSPVMVSVIVTAHNYGRFLDQCMNSVLSQTYQDFELIVVDDGSTDDTAAVLQKYARNPKVSVHRLAGVGLAAACNYGIRHSQGEFVLRLDADDFLDSHALVIEAETLIRHSEIDLVYPDFYTVDEAGRFLGYTRVPRIQEGAKLLDANPLAGGAMYRRTCCDAIGGYNEVLRYQEDFDFWLRFTERFRAHGIGLPLLSYRQHSNSMSKNRANRSAARRYVKRQYVETRHILDRGTILIAIPGVWPSAPERPETLLCQPLSDSTAIGLTVEAARLLGRPANVVVSSDHPEVRRAAAEAGAEVIPGIDCPANASERPELAWLRGLLLTWSESGESIKPNLIVLASPYCPLRHPERLREAVDTLLIHDCDLVVSVDSEPVIPWTISHSGFQAIQPETAQLGGRMVREAGELMAVRTSWLNENRPLAESVVGYLELLYPEWWCLKDEATRQVCQNLLQEAATVKVRPFEYLREK